MRVIFITDIHGNYDKFMNLLKVNEYDESKDTLILGGDYFDRGKQSKAVAQWLVNNYKKPNVFLIKGNHDEFMIDLFNGDNLMYEFNYKNNGLKNTIQSFVYPRFIYDPVIASNTIKRKFPELPEIFNNLLNYVEVGGIVYTHGALPENYDSTATDKDWKEARWAHSERFAAENQIDKTIAIGHWSIQHLDVTVTKSVLDKPIQINNVIFCDSGINYPNTNGFAFIKNIEDEEIA